MNSATYSICSQMDNRQADRFVYHDKERKWRAMDSGLLQSMAMNAPKGKRNSSVVLEFEDKAITELFRFIAKLGAQNKIAKTV